MPGNPLCTVFVGNLDEKVDEKLLYEIMVQAGPVVDMYIPRDKETSRHKGYAFAEYTSEENAQYAVTLFSGLVSLYNKSLRFAISGQDKPSPVQNSASVSPHQAPPMQSPTKSLKQMLPPPKKSPAQATSCRPLPYLSPVSSYSSAYNSPGAIKNGYNLENSPHSQSYNHNSKVIEARSFDSHLTSVGRMGHRSSVHSAGYAFAYPSY
eukprot:Gb_18308 [translate_table: standard]